MRTIKKNWVYLLFLFAVFFAANRLCSRDTGKEGVIRLSMQSFRTTDGWGYNLLTNDSVYIHQEFIPAVGGRKAFASKEDAEKTGALAMQKLKKSRFPVITTEELDSLQIRQ